MNAPYIVERMRLSLTTLAIETQLVDVFVCSVNLSTISTGMLFLSWVFPFPFR